MPRSKVQLKTESFTNSLKQVINPGDSVVVVTSGYNHAIRIRRGTYLGTKNSKASCIVEIPTTKYRYIDTKVDVPWNEWPKYTSATYGTDTYRDDYAKYVADIEEFKKKIELYETITKRGTTLQLNRLYKLDTSIFDMKI